MGWNRVHGEHTWDGTEPMEHSGIAEHIREGVDRIRESLGNIREGVDRIRASLGNIREGVDRIRASLGNIREGVDRIRASLGNIRGMADGTCRGGRGSQQDLPGSERIYGMEPTEPAVQSVRLSVRLSASQSVCPSVCQPVSTSLSGGLPLTGRYDR